MRTLRKHVRRASSLLCGVACGALSSCVGTPQPGTPLPEPPDFKTPDLTRILGSDPEAVAHVDAASTPLVIELRGPSSSVAPDALLYAINLDSDTTPLSTVPGPDGSFAFPATTALANDRIRLVSRVDSGHSASVDLMVVAAGGGMGRVDRASSPALTCFSVSPIVDLTADADGAEITLENRCDGDVGIDDLRLRFNDQGFALGSAPSTLASGASVRVRVTDTREPGSVERGDIVLLRITPVSDATSPSAVPDRYAISVYSRLAP